MNIMQYEDLSKKDLIDLIKIITQENQDLRDALSSTAAPGRLLGFVDPNAFKGGAPSGGTVTFFNSPLAHHTMPVFSSPPREAIQAFSKRQEEQNAEHD